MYIIYYWTWQNTSHYVQVTWLACVIFEGGYLEHDGPEYQFSGSDDEDEQLLAELIAEDMGLVDILGYFPSHPYHLICYLFVNKIL